MALEGVRESPRGALLAIRVTPRSAKPGIGEPRDGRIVVRVSSAPAGGEANEAVRKLLSKRLRVARTHVLIERGHTAREKTVLLEGVSEAEAARRLTAAWGAR